MAIIPQNSCGYFLDCRMIEKTEPKPASSVGLKIGKEEKPIKIATNTMPVPKHKLGRKNRTSRSFAYINFEPKMGVAEKPIRQKTCTKLMRNCEPLDPPNMPAKGFAATLIIVTPNETIKSASNANI